ncbi:MAG: phage terminase large subunit [Holosporales bacterium]|jgi:predicted phage terminase large subunit-like protein|nr:phage terminase large subunit [Holosporales bacterium]
MNKKEIILPMYNWDEVARDSQKIPKGDWFLWLIRAGRGFGKTRTGAESVMKLVEEEGYRNIAIVGKTIDEARKIMVEGHSGIMSTSLAYEGKVRFYPSRNELVWENGAKARLYSGDRPESLRGPQFDLVWTDEFAKYKRGEELWEQILMTLRLGSNPRCIMTTTPRPLQILIELSANAFTHLTRGSTFENKDNLGARFIENMKNRFEGTNLGRQELLGEIVEDNDAMLWKAENIKYKDIKRSELKRIVIGVDPAVTNNENSDETGIIVAGVGKDDKIYVLEDLSGKYRPPQWAKIVAKACEDYQANRVVAEINNGGDLVEEMLRTVSPYIPYSSVRAVKGKTARAEPIALLYESGNVYHIQKFDKLEKQMKNMSHSDEDNNMHDDRVDALVWSLSEIKNKKPSNVSIELI